MTLSKPLIAFAGLTLLGIAACDQIAPATPEPTPGPLAQSNALNGTYNLLRSNCGEVGNDKSLVIDGNKFLFPNASCTVVSRLPRSSSTKTRIGVRARTPRPRVVWPSNEPARAT